MLSVDHELEGPVICVRESMDKFDAPHSLDIEIAGYFDKPGPMFLNRPLIAILETLGVPPSAFMELQQKALKETEEALSSIGSSAQLLERHGLGSSFRLPGLLHSLHKLGLHFRDLGDPFLMQTIRYGIMDIKRELKHRARIPVDGGWTLVGIADIHDFLREGEIFGMCLPKTRIHPEVRADLYYSMLEGRKGEVTVRWARVRLGFAIPDHASWGRPNGLGYWSTAIGFTFHS
jgi:RNA-dependent RNA polymerase